MYLDYIAEILFVLLLGIAIGALSLFVFHRIKLGNYQKIAKGILQKAEQESLSFKKTQELSLKQTHLEHQKELELTWQNERRKIQREEERLKSREDKLEGRISTADKKLADVEKREHTCQSQLSQLELERKSIHILQEKLIHELERSSGLSSTEAKDLLINRLTQDVKADAANLIRRVLREAEDEAEQSARRILATAINRLAVDCVSEATINTVTIPDDMKGRIIGREGRNIRTLERETGINFIVDETPGAVVLSGFDPIRMQVAKLSLNELLLDGRVFPTRIEELVAKNKLEVKKQIKQYGEEAALRAGVMNLHPEIILLLGKLKFRFSFGQNVLEHSLEVAHLMGLIAAELKLDIRLAKRIGLLHDMGKALSHEVEGSHAIIGHDFALKHGESKEVANGIGCHHGEIQPTTIEAGFCSTADALSASRIGARNEAVEQYLQRLKRLEELATESYGVEEAHAMQAGREIRVVVRPEQVDDDGAVALARELTKKIENELTYPGKIKVIVIREKRAVEYAI